MSAPTAEAPPTLVVDLPAGGTLHLQSPDEVKFWEESLEKYGEEYALMKQNDLVTLGLLLQQQVLVFRCQIAVNGMEPEVDANEVPTGRYKRVEIDAGEMAAYHSTMMKASGEMRALEKALGIDKATREKGGKHTVDSYVREIKRAAHEMGVHIAQRVVAYEKFNNELRVRLRILANGDEEDMRYHNITKDTVLSFAWKELKRLEEIDQKFAREKGKLFVGKL